MKVDPTCTKRCWTAWRCWVWLLTEASSTQMSATRDAAGKIVSVEVSYPDDFTGQMLRYSEQFSFLPDVN